MLNGQLHLEHRIKKQTNKKTEQFNCTVQCAPVAANPSETHGLPCAFITHREDLRATRSTETLLLVGKKMRGVVEKREGGRADGKQEDGEKD